MQLAETRDIRGNPQKVRLDTTRAEGLDIRVRAIHGRHFPVEPYNSAQDYGPSILVHGTTLACVTGIKREGLSKMSRESIHLADYPPSDRQKLYLIDKPVRVDVDVPRAIDLGLALVKAPNEVALRRGDSQGLIPLEALLCIRMERQGEHPVT